MNFLRRLCILTVVASQITSAQTTPKHGLPAEFRNRCAMCHTCTTPTKSDPCLILCPRTKESTGLFSPADGPGAVLMDKMEGEYGPVVFNHRTHAQMAEMSGGCFGCHHYNDTALQILSCVTCHPSTRQRENVNIPDLKGAYHRQCLDCHRQWSGSPDCKSCHLGNTAGKSRAQILNDASKARKDHPPVPAPERKLYVTKEQQGSMVTFYHSDHVERFGLKCTDCHRREGCISCHDKRPDATRKAAGGSTGDFDAVHARCSACHAEKTCTWCHRASESPRFDHGRSAGWPLKPYHAALACNRCHGTGKVFAKVSGDCATCHKKWESGSFDHSVTGLKLDDTHSALDCADCHPDRAFGKPPVCVPCHEDKTFPKQKPGKTVRP